MKKYIKDNEVLGIGSKKICLFLSNTVGPFRGALLIDTLGENTSLKSPLSLSRLLCLYEGTAKEILRRNSGDQFFP